MAMLCHTEYANQKKAQIETALLNLMMSQPYQDISVTDICQALGMPRRTFYHYFENKEAVLDSMIESLMQQCFLNALFDIRLGMDHMEKSFTKIFHVWEGENRKKLDALIRNDLESRLFAWASRWIQEEQLNAVLKYKLDSRLMEMALMVGITDFFSLLFYWSRGGYQEPAEQMAKYAVWVLPHAFYKM